MCKTDEQHVQIAKQEYGNYEVGQEVTIGKNKNSIGYVSDVINNKKTGEQTYVITDGNPKTQNPEDVKNVTFLNQGSLGPDKAVQNPGEFKRDWWDNNKQIAGNVLKSYEDPQTVLPATVQMQSTANSLNSAMDKYPNALFDAYGHSQASSNVQYALGALDSQEKVNRIHGAFVYQGPNAYSMMSLSQRKRIEQLKGRVFNFVDEKDLVPIGYRVLVGQINPFHVGTLIFVDSTEKGLGEQHMWGGYQFSNGDLKVTKESLQEFQQMKQEYIKYTMNNELNLLVNLRKKLTASGGGLSSNEKIYLDSAQALSVVSIASMDFEVSLLGVMKIYQDGIKDAEELWQKTLSDAMNIGHQLERWEIYDALESVGCMEYNIVGVPTQQYQMKIDKIREMSEQFKSLENQIKAKISEIVARDSELAQQLRG